MGRADIQDPYGIADFARVFRKYKDANPGDPRANSAIGMVAAVEGAGVNEKLLRELIDDLLSGITFLQS